MDCGLRVSSVLCSWDFPGKTTGVDCHFLLQGIFLTQGLKSGLPHSRQTLYCLSYQVRVIEIRYTISRDLITFIAVHYRACPDHTKALGGSAETC